eukprot:scaffold224990_cov17-Prasinocladus_malaysianus.AAC.1
MDCTATIIMTLFQKRKFKSFIRGITQPPRWDPNEPCSLSPSEAKLPSHTASTAVIACTTLTEQQVPEVAIL